MDRAKLALIINNSSYDRVSYALSVAALAAAHFKEVHVLFTYGAVRRLVQGKTDVVGEETNTWIREEVTLGVEKGTIPKISEMIFHLNGFGGKIYACVAALAFHNIGKDNLIEEVDDVIGISAFLEKTDGATMLYV